MRPVKSPGKRPPYLISERDGVFCDSFLNGGEMAEGNNNQIEKRFWTRGEEKND